MLRRRTSMLALCLGVSSMWGQTKSVLDQFIQEAFEHNLEIQAVRQRVAEARGLLRQAGIRPVPTVEASAGSGRPLGSQGEEEYTAGYFQPIETGGKRSKRLLIAGKALELAEAEYQERTRQLGYEISIRYIDAAASQGKIAAIQQIVDINRDSYKLVDARVQRDDAAPLERQLLLVELNRSEAQRVTTLGQVEAAWFDLRRMTGNESVDHAKSPAQMPLTSVTTALDELKRRALESRPDLRAARALESQSSAELQLTEAQSRPDLTASAQYAHRISQFEDPLRTTNSGSPLRLPDRDNILTVGISIPLQTRKRNSGNIDAAISRQRASALRRQHLEATIPLEVEAAWQKYQASSNVLTILNRGVVEESRRNLSVIRQAYNLGQLRLLDVLNEQRRLLETELTYVDAEADLARSIAELERAIGGGLK